MIFVTGFSGPLGESSRGVTCKAPSGFWATVSSAFDAVYKPLVVGMVNAVTVGQGGKYAGAAVDKLMKNAEQMTARMSRDELYAWINQASNEEVSAWAIGVAASTVKKQVEGENKSYFIRNYTQRGLTLSGFYENAVEAALLYYVIQAGRTLGAGGPPMCVAQHAVKAIISTEYGDAAQGCVEEEVGELPGDDVTSLMNMLGCLRQRRVLPVAVATDKWADQSGSFVPSTVFTKVKETAWYRMPSRVVPLGIGAAVAVALAIKLLRH